MASTRQAPSHRAAPVESRADQRINGHNADVLERRRVTDIQRARMLNAMAEVACEHGAANVTVAHVVERAGVSRRTFYELFDDRDACFLAAVQEAVARASERILPSYCASGPWRARIRASLGSFLGFLDEEPFMGRLLVVETLAGGRRSLEGRTGLTAHLFRAIEAGASEPRALQGTTRLTAEGVVGALLSVIHGRLLEDRQGALIELVNPLMSMTVLPYLGPAAARRELERAPAPATAHPHTVAANPLKDLRMRLTYRTVRVLTAVAAHPGASNRAIADVAEVSDQGQISKLLTRLEKLGLIEKTGSGSARGEPNAWTLTQRGWQMHGALGEPAAHA